MSELLPSGDVSQGPEAQGLIDVSKLELDIGVGLVRTVEEVDDRGQDASLISWIWRAGTSVSVSDPATLHDELGPSPLRKTRSFLPFPLPFRSFPTRKEFLLVLLEFLAERERLEVRTEGRGGED